MGDFHTAEEQLASFNQLVDVVANADMIHAREV
jgi:hypothetical protein